MILLRIRPWGTEDWTTLRIDGPDEEREETIVPAAVKILSDSGEDETFHAQRWDEESGRWEDFE